MQVQILINELACEWHTALRGACASGSGVQPTRAVFDGRSFTCLQACLCILARRHLYLTLLYGQHVNGLCMNLAGLVSTCSAREQVLREGHGAREGGRVLAHH